MSVKKITVLLFGSIGIAVLISLLNNCAQKHGRSGNPNDPNDPTYQNGGYGFNPDELRGGESFQYSSDGNGNTHQRQSSEEIEDPLYKSPRSSDGKRDGVVVLHWKSIKVSLKIFVWVFLSTIWMIL